ncbi:uncharacterized protein [Penaeus vannamei]|uniref:uncharacterized protein n=1 Tax=Penaeus vannamei TaxID=6689 RepID=UPI00387FA60F
MFVGDPFTAAWLVIAENARGKGCSGSHVLSSSSGLSVYDSPVVLLRQSGSRPHLEPGAGASRRTSSMASSGDHQDSGRNSSATDHTDDEQEAVARVRMRLFVGNPRDTVLTGVCVCMTRTNPQRSVTEENVHRSVYIRTHASKMYCLSRGIH